MTFENHLREMITDAVRAAVREELATAGTKQPLAAESFLTYAEAAAQLRVSVSTIKRWVEDKTLKAYGSGKLSRVKAGDVASMLAPRAVEELPADAPKSRAALILSGRARRTR